MPDRILVLVEGVEKEIQFFKSMNHQFLGQKDNIELVPFGCNIYSLFKLMEEYDFDIELEKAIDVSPTIPPEQKEKIKKQKFPFKYLVFDFDFQDSSLTEEEKIKALDKMLSVYNNDSDNGLLLINYPMFESFQEPISSQKTMEDSKVKVGDFCSYKESIANRKLGVNCKTLQFSDFKGYIHTTLCELNYLFNYSFGEKIPYKELVNDDFQINVYHRQIEQLQEYEYVYPLNTSVLIPVIYLGVNKYNSISQIENPASCGIFLVALVAFFLVYKQPYFL